MMGNWRRLIDPRASGQKDDDGARSSAWIMRGSPNGGLDHPGDTGRRRRIDQDTSGTMIPAGRQFFDPWFFQAIRKTALKIRIPIHLLLLALAAPASAALPGDPEGSGVIVHALVWLQGTLLGTIATTIAVIAIAAVGFLMLTGRINWRHGAVVVIGCFILFGAASIVAGIRATATGM